MAVLPPPLRELERDPLREPPLRDAEPLLFVALLLRADPRPPFDVRLAMPHTVSAPASPVTTATGVAARTLSRAFRPRSGYRA
ncbi:hypothetical protein GCM10023108_42910 [Saccharopolyspora hordei]